MNRCQPYASAQAKDASCAETSEGVRERVEAGDKHQASVHRPVCTFLNETNFAVSAFLGYVARPLAKDTHAGSFAHQEYQGE